MLITSRTEDYIVKSNYKINNIVDAIIAPNGEITKVDTHHHVEVALEIIAEIDSDQHEAVNGNANWIRSDKRELKEYQNLLELSDSEIKEYLDKMNPNKCSSHYWQIYRLSDRVLDPAWRNILAEKITRLEDAISRLKAENQDRKKQGYELKRFEAANKNRGWDSAEYIIINCGYLIVENGYLIYNPTHVTQAQANQVQSIRQRQDGKSYLVKKSAKTLREERNSEINALREQGKMYQCWENRFHCPSGFPRQGYLRWTRRCHELGIHID